MATIEPYETRAGETRYRVRYRKPDHRQTDKRGFKTKRDAKMFAATVEVSKATGAYVAPAAGRTTFKSIADSWLRGQHHLSPSTYARYEGIVEQLKTEFETPINKVTRPRLRDWISTQVDAETPAETVHKRVGVLRRILMLAVEDGHLAANPADGLRLPPIVPAEMRFLTLDELRALAEAADHDAPAIWLLGVCGLRMGELVGLQHDDIDRAGGVLHIVRSTTLVGSRHVTGPPKNGKRRVVPLPQFVAKQLPTGIGAAPVFTSPRGDLIRHTNWRTRVFDPAVQRAGLGDLHPHELRHTAASLAIKSGANIKAVQAMLGHARASISLDRYGHLYPDDLQAITGHLDHLLTS